MQLAFYVQVMYIFCTVWHNLFGAARCANAGTGSALPRPRRTFRATISPMNYSMRKLLLFVLLASAVLAQTPVHENILSWTWTQTSGDPPTSFTIQRASPASTGTGPAAFATIGTTAATVLTYTDATVAGGQTFFYQVIAVNPGGQSAPSNVASATTPFSVPNAPGALQIISK